MAAKKTGAGNKGVGGKSGGFASNVTVGGKKYDGGASKSKGFDKAMAGGGKKTGAGNKGIGGKAKGGPAAYAKRREASLKSGAAAAARGAARRGPTGSSKFGGGPGTGINSATGGKE